MSHAPDSKRVVIALARPDTDHTFDRGNPDLAVADLPRAGGSDDGVNDSLHKLVVDYHVNSDLRDELDGVFGSAVDLGVPSLPAVPLDFGDGQTQHTGDLDGMPDVIDREGLDDSGDQLHGYQSSTGSAGSEAT